MFFNKRRRLFFHEEKCFSMGRSCNYCSVVNGVVLDSGLCWVVYTVVGSNCSCYFSLRRGLTPGLAAGLLWGLLHFAVGKVSFLSVEQVLIEYVIAFAVMGLAGLLYSPFQKALKAEKYTSAITLACTAAFVGVGVRYFFHYIAGVIFWGKYAPEGMSPWLYSLTVNGTAALGTFIVVVIACVALIRQKKIWIAH